MGLVGMEFFDKIFKDELPKGICEFGLAKARGRSCADRCHQTIPNDFFQTD